MSNRRLIALIAAIFTAVLLTAGIATAAHKFRDVPNDHYAHEAANWAYEAGITTGTSTDTFSPDAPLNRAQMITFLHRYNKWHNDNHTHTRLKHHQQE